MAVGSTFQAILRKLRADYASRGALRHATIETLEQRRLLTISGASIGFESGGVEGSSVRLDLSASTDGTLTGWTVGWGDGNTSDDIPGDASYVDHTYTEEGHYDVNATVTDSVDDTGGGSYSGSYGGGSSGGSNSSYSTSTSIDVDDAPLDAGDAVTIGPMMTEDFSGTVGHFHDENTSGSDSGDFTATIDWGDGSDTSDGTISGGDVNGTHTYATAGTYNLTITVNDDGGESVELGGRANVWAPTLNSVTAADDVDTLNYLVADSDSPNRDLYLAQNDSSNLVVDFSASYVPDSTEAGRLILWSVDGAGDVSPGSGNFSGTNPTVTISPGGGSYEFVASFGVDLNGDGILEAGETTRQFHGHGLDASTKTVSHNVAGSDLSATDEKSVGAFIPVNDDDDNYNGVPDFEETGAVTGEDDLLPITLHAVAGSEPGYYSINAASLHVFTDKDRTPLEDPNILSSVDTTLYVEGTTVGVDTIRVDWTGYYQTVYGADHIKVTTFSMSGAADVPGDAIYEYKATGALSSSHWISGDGTIESGSGTSDVTILWGAGADVEKSPYLVNSNYTWDFEVNVVKVSLLMDGSNYITYSSHPSQVGATTIDSGNGGPSIIANITVGQIAGPVVNGVMRGIKFIQMGFIQNVRFTEKSGDFSSIGKQRQSSLQTGSYYVDYITNPSASRSTAPRYDTNNVTPFSGSVAYYQPPSTTNAAITGKNFQMTDEPILMASDITSLSSTPIDYLNLVFDANLYFAVRTTQAVNGSDAVYTERAKAAWTFNGSGAISTALWTPSSSAGTTGSSAFAEVTNGDQVPITTGTPANDLLLSTNESWNTIDLP